MQGTFPCIATGLNDVGATVGNYTDSSGMNHGFVRARDGSIAIFDPPDSAGTYPSSINLEGAITGTYVGTTDGVDHGFLRAPDGRFTRFDAPGAGTGQFQGTIPSTINAFGVIVGYTLDANLAWHGFVRVPDGRITTFASTAGGTGSSQGTNAFGINLTGEIIGVVIDSNGSSHGFLRTSGP